MRSNEVYLRHILDEIDYLLRQSQDLAYEQLLKDETLRRAFARSIEIIGEAAKNIPADFKKKRKEIDWKGMSGMRDVLIHRYFEVDWEIVWKVMRDRLPELKKAVEKVLAEEK